MAPCFFERLHNLRNGGALLTDSNIDAVELLALVVAASLTGFWLMMVSMDSGLAGLAVTNDQLALATADGHKAIESPSGQSASVHAQTGAG
jgi:hypothetical protein